MSKLTPDEEISCLITAIETLERRDFIGRTVDEKNGYCTATNDIKEIIKKYHSSLLTQKELLEKAFKAGEDYERERDVMKPNPNFSQWYDKQQ